MAQKQEYIVNPFTIIADTRENHPFSFRGFKADAPYQDLPLLVPIESGTLQTGDYSVKGFERRISVERKSASDAYSTFGPQNRDRFERELERLNQMDFAAVVVEASCGSLIHDPPPHTRFTPKSFFRSVIAWNIRFPKVHFEMCADRGFAERMTLRWLQRFWLDEQERLKAARKGA